MNIKPFVLQDNDLEVEDYGSGGSDLEDLLSDSSQFEDEDEYITELASDSQKQIVPRPEMPVQVKSGKTGMLEINK